LKEDRKFPANNHDVELARRIMGFGANRENNYSRKFR